MYILAIETTGAYASVALLGADSGMSDPKILEVIHGNDRFSHLQNLTPQIDRIVKKNGLSIGDITAIAVSHGPGSFTGIRIGVSTARALAQILDLPCVPVSSLEGLALRALEESRAASDTEESRAASDTEESRLLICPLLDARRKQVYAAAYELADGRPVCRIPEASCLMTDFLEEVDRYVTGHPDRYRGIFFLGDGIDTCGQIIRDWQQTHREEPAFAEIICAEEKIRYQDAGAVAARGFQMLKEGKSCGYMQLQPEYLRMAEAEKKLRDRMASREGAGDREAKGS